MIILIYCTVKSAKITLMHLKFQNSFGAIFAAIFCVCLVLIVLSIALTLPPIIPIATVFVLKGESDKFFFTFW